MVLKSVQRATAGSVRCYFGLSLRLEPMRYSIVRQSIFSSKQGCGLRPWPRKQVIMNSGENNADGPWFDTDSLPANALFVAIDMGGNVYIAITDMKIWGDTGVDCAGSRGSCAAGADKSGYNGNGVSISNGIIINASTSMRRF